MFARELRKYKQSTFYDVHVFGEERLRDETLDLTLQSHICVLVDALDGTDLLERGLGNWCCAAVFFYPSGKPGERIRAAVVGLPSSEIYFASADESSAWVEERVGKRREVHGRSGVTALKDATICYYGQKMKNYMSLHESGLARKMSTMLAKSKTKRKTKGKTEPKTNFRIYNLAGIPMMLKLVDKLCQASHGIDAVLDIDGQKPHDVVAGAFIAMKAGAVMRNSITRELVTFEQLEQSLLKPASPDHELTYVLSATDELCGNILVNLMS